MRSLPCACTGTADGGSTGVIYWEGAVEGKGTSGSKKVACEGYVELTGYAGSLGGLF